MPPDGQILRLYASNSISAGAPSQILLGSLQRSHRPYSCFKAVMLTRSAGHEAKAEARHVREQLSVYEHED